MRGFTGTSFKFPVIKMGASRYTLFANWGIVQERYKYEVSVNRLRG